ncbi:MAG: hypothetical protein IPJ81_01860 [Chitinophagaceae bacterium]|nr:hypothetical protein [Chitinophagaceae bacterium]
MKPNSILKMEWVNPTIPSIFSKKFLKPFAFIALLASSFTINAQTVYKLKADNTITTVNLDDYTNITEQAKWERTDDASFLPPTSANFLDPSTTFIIDHQVPMTQIDITCNDGAMTAGLELFAYAKALNLNSLNGVNFTRLKIEGDLNYNTNIDIQGTSTINRLILNSASLFYITNGATININEVLDQNRGNLSLIDGQIVIKNGAQYTYASGTLEFLHPSCHITGEGTAAFISYDGLGTSPIIRFTNVNGLENGPGNHFQFDNVANIQLPDASLLGDYYFLGGYGDAVTGSLMPSSVVFLVTDFNAGSVDVLSLTNDLVCEQLALYGALKLGNKNLDLINKNIINAVPFGGGLPPSKENNIIVTDGSDALTIQNFIGEALFPLAHTTNLGANYSPVLINNTSVTAESFTIRVQDDIQFPYDGTQYKAATLTWFIEEGTTGGTTADISFGWNKTEEELGFDFGNSRVAHYDNNIVTLINGTTTDPDAFAHTFAVTGITSFSPWSILSPITILPVKLISFNAAIINKDEAKLSWSTATENNNDHFDIERSTDGRNFAKISETKGQGNSSVRTDYSLITTIKGLSGTIYYRLKQVDISGKITYSSIKTLKIASIKMLLL